MRFFTLTALLMKLALVRATNNGTLVAMQACANAVLMAFYVEIGEFQGSMTDYTAVCSQLLNSYSMMMHSLGDFQMITDIWRDKPNNEDFDPYYKIFDVNSTICDKLCADASPLYEYFASGNELTPVLQEVYDRNGLPVQSDMSATVAGQSDLSATITGQSGLSAIISWLFTHKGA